MSELEVFWSVVGKVAGGLALILALWQTIEALHKKSPSGKLETRVKEVEDNLKKDFEHFKKVDTRIDNLEHKTDDTQKQLQIVNEGIQRIGKSQIALLRHTIDGNGIDKLREEADDLTDFFIDRSKP